MLISRTSAGNFSFSVFRKPTHTGSYLNFASNNPKSHKRAVVKSLMDRAKNLCSQDQLPKELQTVKSTLRKNGYPNHFIRNQNVPPVRSQDEGNVQLRYVSTPYISGTSERVGKILRKHNIILSNKPSNTLYN